MSLTRQIAVGALLAVVVFTPAFKAHGEELTLKTGEKIVGTIVGFKDGMFRVKTSYGFALVRKSDVVNINFGEKTAKSSTAGKSAAPSTAKENAISRTVRPDAESAKEAALPALKSPVPAASHPLTLPFPKHVQEHVEGPDYVNDTFHFALFKPLDWNMLDEVPKETGSGIMAMADQDGQTVVVVDRQVWSGPPTIGSDQAEARLRASYEEYKKLSESPVQVDGRAGLERAFDGVVDGVEWHGISVHLAVGNVVYGIIGVTSAEQYQFQQDVIEKIIRSFRILPASNHPS